MFCLRFSLQYVTEKMGGAEGTKLDMEFTDMERVIIKQPKIINLSFLSFLFVVNFFFSYLQEKNIFNIT